MKAVDMDVRFFFFRRFCIPMILSRIVFVSSDKIRLQMPNGTGYRAHRRVIFCVIYDNVLIYLRRQSFLLNDVNRKN